MSHVLPNFIMLLDALTNTYLVSRKSKDEDNIKKKFGIGSALSPSLLLREPK